MRFRKRKSYIEWESYQDHIAKIDEFLWQQAVRQENLHNLPCAAEA
ncbi:hypothetical protein JW868_00180 [Candidatus Woesearchaeota archaeon]|nr:hypothetical protein [Candidatus Woesearchaeota archaeon]